MPLGNGKRNKSCGCRREKHKKSKTKLYRVWSNMKQRILNSNFKQFKDYGGRGITICPEWAESYIVFKDWALNNGYQKNLQINRKNNDGNYEPSNCNFVTRLENIRKTRKTTSLKIVNEIRELDSTGNYTRKELAEKYNLNYWTILNIVNNKIWKNIIGG